MVSWKIGADFKEKSDGQPPDEFHHHGPVLNIESGIVVVSVDKVQIAHWLESPLNTCIDINVLRLGIVLDKCCPE